MKTFFSLILLTCSLFAHPLWAKHIDGTPHISADIAASHTIVAHVQGMVCDFCAQGLEKTFGKREEVEKVTVSLEHGTVTLQFYPGKQISDEVIIGLIKDNGINTSSIDHTASNSTAENASKNVSQ